MYHCNESGSSNKTDSLPDSQSQLATGGGLDAYREYLEGFENADFFQNNDRNLSAHSEHTQNDTCMLSDNTPEAINLNPLQASGSEDSEVCCSSQRMTGKRKQCLAENSSVSLRQLAIKKQKTRKSKAFTDGEIKGRCSRYKVNFNQFQTWKSTLTALGYTLEQCVKVICRKSSTNIVKKLIELHHILTEEPYNLSYDHLVKIASYDGGLRILMQFKVTFKH